MKKFAEFFCCKIILKHAKGVWDEFGCKYARTTNNVLKVSDTKKFSKET